MKFEYDSDADAGYIYLEYPIKNGAVKKTVELNDNITLDLDEKGKLIGIEVLDASKIVKKRVLQEAQAV